MNYDGVVGDEVKGNYDGHCHAAWLTVLTSIGVPVREVSLSVFR